MANRVLLWRHGQTDWNTLNRFQGHSDIPLNAVGQYQAKHAANILVGMQPTKIISSDLSRARDTAQALGDLTKLMVVFGKAKLVLKIAPKISKTLSAGLMVKITQPEQPVRSAVMLQIAQ